MGGDGCDAINRRGMSVYFKGCDAINRRGISVYFKGCVLWSTSIEGAICLFCSSSFTVVAAFLSSFTALHKGKRHVVSFRIYSTPMFSVHISHTSLPLYQLSSTSPSVLSPA